MFDLKQLVRKNILNLKPYSTARDEYKFSDGVFLDANESPYGDYNRYPDPYQTKLKEEIGKLKSISSNHIFLGNGSDEAIDLLFRIFCNPGEDKALIFTPTYGMYEVSAAINQVELIKQPLDNDFQVEQQLLDEVINDDKLKLIFICSPNNPTGNCINDIAIICNKFKGIVVVDEAYVDFSNKPSWMTKMDTCPNLVVLQTFSKAWGMAAARVGMAFASAEIIQLFNNVKSPYNVSLLNQNCILNMITESSQYNKTVNTVLAERDKLINALNSFSFVKRVYPSEANFVLIALDDADKCYNFLINEKVIVRNRSSVIADCLRITVGAPAENEKLLTVLKNYK